MPNYIYPTAEQRRAILEEYGEEFERNIKNEERERITAISRSTAWLYEKEGLFPARRHLGSKTCVWLLSDLLWWVRNPPTIYTIHNPYKRRKNKDANEGE